MYLVTSLLKAMFINSDTYVSNYKKLFSTAFFLAEIIEEESKKLKKLKKLDKSRDVLF